MKILWIIFFLLPISEPRSTPQSPNYIAAVVEYEVNRNVEQNRVMYTQLIAQAAQQNADIVVFPELTLTNSSVSFPVPINGHLVDYPIPALNPHLYDSLLVSMSEAARDNEIYLVINVRELMDCRNNDTGEYCPEAKEYIFNTNVVFDRRGAVIDRYRKINLFGEYAHTPALRPDLGIFTTDFGVTFGHFICFDLMFQVPAIQVVQQHQITDIIFPTMWFSELPYLTAVQIQESYAYALNVNFLGAGANNVGVGSTGSGIYSGKAGALISIMSGVPTTRLLVATVPKYPGQVSGPVPGPIYDNPTDHDALRLITDPSLPSHISRPLSNGFQEFSIIDKDVSCTFKVRINIKEGENTYRYRAAGFSGVRSFSGVATGGSMICSVVACTNDSITTCGHRFPTYAPNATAVFEEISITATFPTPVRVADLECNDRAVFPVAAASNIMPLEPNGYTYNVTSNGNTTTYSLVLNDFNSELYGFAVWGRVYAPDGQEADPPVDENSTEGIVEINSGNAGVKNIVNSAVPLVVLLNYFALFF